MNDASAVRDHHLSPDRPKFRSNRGIEVEKLRKNVSEIDRDFGHWFDPQGLPGQGAAARRRVIIGPEQRLSMRDGHKEQGELAPLKTQRGVAAQSVATWREFARRSPRRCPSKPAGDLGRFRCIQEFYHPLLI